MGLADVLFMREVRKPAPLRGNLLHFSRWFLERKPYSWLRYDQWRLPVTPGKMRGRGPGSLEVCPRIAGPVG